MALLRIDLAALAALLIASISMPAAAQQQVIDMCRQSTSAPWTPCSSTNPPPGGGGAAPLAYSGSASASVATTSGTLVIAGAYTRALQICTLPTSTTNVWLNVTGGAAAASAGVPIYAGGGCASFGGPALPLPTGAITAITDGGVAQTVTLAGG